jgi:5-methylphenazine-1-carboxylate 1-monooxygenase
MIDRNIEIAVIGGGIVGLTTALSLHAAGFRPTVYEAVATPAPMGVGINLLPHAVRELTELGLLDELLSLGIAIDSLHYLTSQGEKVWQEPRGLAASYHSPQIAIHRGKLQIFLLEKTLERLGAEAVQLGHKLVALDDDGSRPRARFAKSNGQEVIVQADLLLGADGIHSAVRRHFYPNEGAPRWNGITLWRSTTLAKAPMGGKAMVWAGWHAQKFVAYPIGVDPISGLDILNWICDLKVSNGNMLPVRDWNRPGKRDDFAGAFTDWHWSGVDVPAIIANSGQIYEFPMVDRDPLPQWTFGMVTLLGDAAHPMYPIGSNGATQGILDSRVLAFHLANAKGITEALDRYEAARRDATSKIVLMNREMGPDRVLDLAVERRKNSDEDLSKIFPIAERAAIAQQYKQVAGFSPASLNARASLSVK